MGGFSSYTPTSYNRSVLLMSTYQMIQIIKMVKYDLLVVFLSAVGLSYVVLSGDALPNWATYMITLACVTGYCYVLMRQLKVILAQKGARWF